MTRAMPRPYPPLLPRWAVLLMCAIWAVVTLISGGAVAAYLVFTEPARRPSWGQAVQYVVGQLFPF